jgi:hypothetical protein
MILTCNIFHLNLFKKICLGVCSKSPKELSSKTYVYISNFFSKAQRAFFEKVSQIFVYSF